jgi:hypothetical protein
MTRLVTLLLFGVCFAGRELPAQNAEALYHAGAFRLAADSFAARTRLAPDVPANWYNLGNAWYRAGDDVAARAAWIRAARALPRDPDIRQALNMVTAPDGTSAGDTVVAIFTPGEVIAAAIVFWILGWALLAFRRPHRIAIPVFLIALIIGILGLAKMQEYQRPVALVHHTNTALRAAPFASAATRRSLGDGTTVETVRSYAGWVLVRRGSEEGWVQRSEIIPLTGNGT